MFVMKKNSICLKYHFQTKRLNVSFNHFNAALLNILIYLREKKTVVYKKPAVKYLNAQDVSLKVF